MELQRQQVSEILPTVIARCKENGLNLSISKQHLAELPDYEWEELFSIASTVIESTEGKVSLRHAFTIAQQLRGGDGEFRLWLVRNGAIFATILAYMMNINVFTPPAAPVPPEGRIDIRFDGAHRRKPHGFSEKTSTQMVVKPDHIDYKTFVDLTAGQKRALEDPYDEFATLPNGVRVRVGYHQVRDIKVKSHGAAVGLPFNISASGGTVTPKTDRNGLAAVSVIANIARSAEIDNPNAPAQFFEGTYQIPQGKYAPEVPKNKTESKNRRFEAYFVYAPLLNRISVYNKETNDFVTICIMSDKEVREFKDTKNFGGGSGWFSPKPKNVPPSESLIPKINEYSPIDFKAIDDRLSQGKDTSIPIIDRNNEPEW